MKMTRWRTSYAQMTTERLGVFLESDVRVITTIKKYYNEKSTTLMILVTNVVVSVISE